MKELSSKSSVNKDISKKSNEVARSGVGIVALREGLEDEIESDISSTLVETGVLTDVVDVRISKLLKDVVGRTLVSVNKVSLVVVIVIEGVKAASVVIISTSDVSKKKSIKVLVIKGTVGDGVSMTTSLERNDVMSAVSNGVTLDEVLVNCGVSSIGVVWGVVTTGIEVVSTISTLEERLVEDAISMTKFDVGESNS